jgi:hypothetical protein
LDPKKLEELRKKHVAKGDGLGPGSYPIPKTNSGPIHTFGSRFESSLGSKSHLKPKKVDGPGPGAYKLPGSLNLRARHPSAVGRTTFGTAGREFSDLPQDTPAPNKYHVAKFTEAAHGYTFPLAIRGDDTQAQKRARMPDPHTYVNKNEMRLQNRQAKSILGGRLEEKQLEDNGIPGPGAYNANPVNTIPGFVLVPSTNAAKRDTADIE